MTEEVIVNRFEQILGEWICIHDGQTTEKDTQHFPNNNIPSIKLCSKTLRIRANDAWTKLPKHHKEFTVAHEMGHREYQHYLEPLKMFKRNKAIGDGSVVKAELQADSYATRLLGKERAIYSLTYFERLVSSVGHTLPALELSRRIERVRNA